MRDYHRPGRSVVRGSRGAAATSSPIATLIAMQVLREGGNAVDAALSACALQSVLEPHNTGIGGDCFALVWDAKAGRAHAIDGAGWSPAALSDTDLLAAGRTRIEETDIEAATVPGAVAAWSHLLARHGTRTLGDILAPAIDYAEVGAPLAERAATDWARETGLLRLDPGARDMLLDADGEAPRAGDVVRLPRLAATLRRLAVEGADGFYRGAIAADLVESLRALGGAHAPEDFADYEAREVTPISTRYRGLEILQMPPSGQGLTVLFMLNLLEGFDIGCLDPHGAERYHLEIEATRLGYQARDAYVADPEFANVPVDMLLSRGHADVVRARINPRRAAPAGGVTMRTGQEDTVYVTVVDASGNACSLINSLFHAFGCRKVCPRTGIVLQSRGAGFRLEPGHPNSLRPRKRPLHTIIPSLALRDGRLGASFGVMGGPFQCVGQVHLIQNLEDFGMNVQEALDSPRGFRLAGAFQAERGIPDTVLRELEAMGHPTARIDVPHGGGQAIVIDPATGTLAGGSDPRKDGCALAY
jgi:gamma-glutamyltranspeptidase / glutathione hydrolase